MHWICRHTLCCLAAAALWVAVSARPAQPEVAVSALRSVRLPGFFMPLQEAPEPGFAYRRDGIAAWFGRGGALFHLASARVGVSFPGANAGARPEGLERLSTQITFLSGSTHASGAPYQAIVYRELYPGIDLVYRGSRGPLKSEFTVRPGATPSSIRIEYAGARSLRIDRDGRLVVRTADGELREEPPEVYQEREGRRVPVPARFRLASRSVAAFEVGAYDPSRPLIVDPEINYSTFLGGSGFDAATAVALDPEGNTYVAGWTASADFPVAGAAQSTSRGGVDAFVAKLSPAGALIYCTYLGGAGDDRAFGIAVDAAGSAYVTGWTSSWDFPRAGAIQSSLRGGRDAFVAKLNPAGNALVYSTYIGGNGYDSGNAIAVDTSGNAYVAGETTSADFPVYHAVQSAFGGVQDAFLLKLDPSARTLLYSTYLGGHGNDRATAVAIDAAGNAYVTGSTDSPDFPVVNAFQASNGGGQDAFVVKLNASGTARLYSTYLGGSGGSVVLPESGYGIAVDAAGSAYVVGVTSSTNFPVANASQPAPAGGLDAFVAKLSPAGNSLLFGTYLGGTGLDVATAVALGASAQIYVSGYTSSRDFPVVQATQAQNAGGYDAFVATLDAAAGTLAFSTYLGGTGADVALAAAADASGVVVAGQTQSADFPLQQPAQNTNYDHFAGFATRIAAVQPQVLFVPVAPCRLVDTRVGSGKTGLFGPPVISANTTRDFPIPSGSCSIPSSAVAYSLNITAFPRGYLGYITIWPAGQHTPVASTLNSWDGRIVANAAVVPAGTAGAVSFFASDAVDLTVDITGYFIETDGSSGYRFFPMTPCRVADTRSDQGKTGPYGPPTFSAASSRVYPMPQSPCGIPSAAVAYSLNVTALTPGRLAYLTVWQTGQPMPVASVISAGKASAVASAALIPAGAGGAISVFSSDATDLIIDINGYFADASLGTGNQFYALTPCRIADTRIGQGQSGAFGPPAFPQNTSRELDIPQSQCSVPSSVVAYSMNVTVAPRTTYLGFLSAWPSGQPFPVVSTLNSWDGNVVANAAIIPAGLRGGVTILVSDATDLWLDINGYFAP